MQNRDELQKIADCLTHIGYVLGQEAESIDQRDLVVISKDAKDAVQKLVTIASQSLIDEK